MRFCLAVLSLVLGIGFSAAAPADDNDYPGGGPDAELQRASEILVAEEFGADAAVTAMTTTDPFEKVLAFYQRLGKEVAPPEIPGLPLDGYERELPSEIRFGPGGMQATPSGVKVKSVYFILDGAEDYEDARDKLMIASPMVLEVEEKDGRMVYSRIRPGTSIIRIRLR